MQEQTNMIDELTRTQLETIEHTLNRLIEHRVNIMDVLTLEDFSSKALLTTLPSDAEVLGLFPKVKESVMEQRTLEASYRQLLLDFEAGLTNLINKHSDLKEVVESERAHWQDRQQDVNDDNTDSILREYWVKFREYCDDHGMPLEHVTWSQHTQYEGFRLSIRSISEREIWLAAWRDPQNRQIAVNLSLRQADSHSENAFNALEVFNTLEEEKEAIENAFSESLRWQKEPIFRSPGPVIGVYKNITPDRNDWQQQFEWMFTTLETLNSVFRPFILKYFTVAQIREQLNLV